MMLVAASATAVCLVAFVARQFMPLSSWFELNPASPSPDETMRAIVYARHGDTSVLHLDTSHARPLVRKNDVLIHIKASSINPCDFKFRRNQAPAFIMPLPKIPGDDVAGDIVELGPDVDKQKFRVGDRVAAMLPILGSSWGAAADYVAVDASLVAKIGADLDYAGAAAMPLVSLTAMQALDNVKGDTKGKKILIHAGAGGVGSFAIQYAKHVLGMYVATTASAANKHFVSELGADLVVDYRTEKFEDMIQNYDVVLDTMSWAYESRTLKRDATVLKPDGYYLNVLSSDWAFDDKEKANGLLSLWHAIFHKMLNLVDLGIVPKYYFVSVQSRGEQLQQVYDLTKIRPVLDRRYDLMEAKAAYDYLEQGHAKGKVILVNE